MPKQALAGTEVDVNEEGYFINRDQWTREVAIEIAKELNIELTGAHWQVIEFARDDHASNGKSPGLRRITKNSGVTTKQIYALFPNGPGKLIARIAGIPKPKSCV